MTRPPEHRESVARWQQDAQEKTTPGAMRHFKPWSPAEDAILLSNRRGSNTEVALFLQRTYAAVANRRTRLQKEHTQ